MCQLRKYKSNCDAWIGFGSLKSSAEIIDTLLFNDQKWEYNHELENLSQVMLDDKDHGRLIRIGKKVGRNEKCICGSGLKYKICCGKNK